MRLTFLCFVLVSVCACTSQPRDFLPAMPMPSAELATREPATLIAFGSCYRPDKSSRVFEQIAARRPDAFVFLGDNVYAASEADDPLLMSLRRSYGALSEVPEFRNLRQTTPVLPIWDDHDMGLNDAGGDWPHKTTSEALFEHVWAFSRGSDVARRPGVYYARTIGPKGQRTQLILLDTRYFRTPLTLNPDPSQGRYTPSTDPDQNLLGDVQWRWLAAQLRKPADLRIIVTSIQLIADGHAWEAWRMLPKERERFYQVLRDTDAKGVVLVSGDRHSAAVYRRDGVLDYPLYELTTSSMNIPLTDFVPNPVQEPGPFRLTDMFFDSNYGLIGIDWSAREIVLRIMDENDRPVTEQVISLSALK